MSMLFGWVPRHGDADGRAVVGAMARALQADPAQPWACWSLPGLAIGVLDGLGCGPAAERCVPVATPDGRFQLWMAGEALAGGDGLPVSDPERTGALEFRAALLAALLARGADAIRRLDGEYQVALWDSQMRSLTLLNDRFGGLPLYWARSPAGFAFAGGVRGVLMAPGVSREPDPEAIREAVTFGGFRLADRTNVAAVKMIPGASVVEVRDGAPVFRRYWRWADLAPIPAQSVDAHIEAVHDLWRAAIRRRLVGAARPGQTLSGGLDSRAILAEAAPQAPRWIAITYGVPGCDDGRYAARAAQAAGATWMFHPLYSGRDPDWLTRRTEFVQPTDGLIDLVDLMHLETLGLQAGLLDVHLSGYVGDAVIGPTFNDVTTFAGAAQRLPFYGTDLGLGWHDALERVRTLVTELDGAPARFALFAHKLPQSTNRWVAAWRPWVRVRKPFLDYEFFDYCQGLPTDLRGAKRLQERWLRARYAWCFARIPTQRTGMPVLTPRWLIQAERARRFGWRVAGPGLARLGLPVRPRLRAYHRDEVVWQGVRERIEGTIVRPGSLVCEMLGRPAVQRMVSAWFDQGVGPTQVVGALYVYECYHRDLAGHLARARSGCAAESPLGRT
jgi:hypothetical protein